MKKLPGILLILTGLLFILAAVVQLVALFYVIYHDLESYGQDYYIKTAVAIVLLGIAALITTHYGIRLLKQGNR